MCQTFKADYVTSPDGLRVRKEPSIKSEILDVLTFGAEVTEISSSGRWMRISDGYICRDYLSKDNPLDEFTYMGIWRITAYAYTGSPCANGNYPTVGYTVACNSLPFGTEIYIDGVGFRTVEDTDGGTMGDEWCDLYLGDYDECVAWGSQERKVWVVR